MGEQQELDEIVDGLQHLEVLGRRMSRRVLRESGAVWAQVWDEVIRIQDANPDVRRLAEAKTDDPERAIVELVPQLMLLNPRICVAVAAFCHGVVDELGYLEDEPLAKDVAPGRDAPDERENDGDGETDVERESVGGQQLQDRLAELEAENAELRRSLAMIAAAVQGAVTELPLRRRAATSVDHGRLAADQPRSLRQSS